MSPMTAVDGLDALRLEIGVAEIARLTGKRGEFQLTNMGVAVESRNIGLIIRAPIDRMQNIVGAAWSITAGWAIPTDVTGPGGTELYKRAVTIESAVG